MSAGTNNHEAILSNYPPPPPAIEPGEAKSLIDEAEPTIVEAAEPAEIIEPEVLPKAGVLQVAEAAEPPAPVGHHHPAWQNQIFKPGQSGNPKGKKPGTLNRATIIKKLMGIRVPVPDPRDPLKTKKMSLYEAAALGQFKAAMGGSSKAWKEIQDTLFGSIPTKVDGNLNLTFAGLAQAAKGELMLGPAPAEEEANDE